MRGHRYELDILKRLTDLEAGAWRVLDIGFNELGVYDTALVMDYLSISARGKLTLSLSDIAVVRLC